MNIQSLEIVFRLNRIRIWRVMRGGYSFSELENADPRHRVYSNSRYKNRAVGFRLVQEK